eukprot:2723736-Lingulodinium_polyedra.AAC.1
MMEELKEATRSCAAGLLGEVWSSQTMERAALPTRYGGLGLRVLDPDLLLNATYWSAADVHAHT